MALKQSMYTITMMHIVCYSYDACSMQSFNIDVNVLLPDMITPQHVYGALGVESMAPIVARLRSLPCRDKRMLQLLLEYEHENESHKVVGESDHDVQLLDSAESYPVS